MRPSAWYSLVLAILSSSATFSQQAAARHDTGTTNISILISAVNSDGTPASVSQSDFRVELNGHKASVEELGHVAPAMHYCLAFDTGRLKDRTTFRERVDQAVAFLNSIPQPGRDFGSLVTFNDDIALVVESDVPKKLTASLSNVKPTELSLSHSSPVTVISEGVTPVDRAIRGCTTRLVKAPADSPRFIFLFTDAEVSFDPLSAEYTGRILARTWVHLYGIGNFRPQRDPSEPVAQRASWDCDPPPKDGIGRLPERNCGAGPALATSSEKDVINGIAEYSGGKCFKTVGKKGLDRALSEISRQLSGLLLMTLAEPAPSFLSTIEIRCSKKHVSITAPHYYEPSTFTGQWP